MKAIKTTATGPTTIELKAVESRALDNALPVLDFIGQCADGELGDAAQAAAQELTKVIEHLKQEPIGAPKE